MHITIDLQTIFYIISSLALVSCGAIFIISSIRKNDLDILRTANKDLRDSINDKSGKIDDLEAKVDILEKKVAVLETKNNDLSILVREALVMYFTRNPKVADQMKEGTGEKVST